MYIYIYICSHVLVFIHTHILSYEGQWFEGKPSGYGIEEILEQGIQYIGHFEDDLWHGWGMMAATHLKAAYIGETYMYI